MDNSAQQEIISIASGNSDDSDGLLKRTEDKDDASDDSADFRILEDINTPDDDNDKEDDEITESEPEKTNNKNKQKEKKKEKTHKK
jgi:hypothetical protein